MGFPVATRNSFLDSEITGTFYIALFTVAPDNEGSGGTEVSAGDYGRLAFGTWGSASGGIKLNSAIAEWAAAATSSWGTIVRAALYDALTGGNFIARGDNTLNKIIESGDIPRFAVGELQFEFNNSVV